MKDPYAFQGISCKKVSKEDLSGFSTTMVANKSFFSLHRKNVYGSEKWKKNFVSL